MLEYVMPPSSIDRKKVKWDWTGNSFLWESHVEYLDTP
jgi:hypothetical protein